MYDPKGESPFMQALPIAVVGRLVGNRLKNTAAAGNLRAKTGTICRTSARWPAT